MSDWLQVCFNSYGLLVHKQAVTGRKIYKLGSDTNPNNNTDVVYRFNRDLMRNYINIDQVDFNNYLLAAGCSFTEGVGINIEDAYWYRLGRLLRISSYSIALGGMGNDVIFYQLGIWLKQFPPPKILLIQLTNYNRVFSFRHGKNLMPAELMGADNSLAESTYYVSRLDNDGNKWDMMRDIIQIELLRKLLPDTKIFVCGVGTGYDSAYDIEQLRESYPVADFKFDCMLVSRDYGLARDGHHGPGSHHALSDELYSRLK